MKSISVQGFNANIVTANGSEVINSTKLVKPEGIGELVLMKNSYMKDDETIEFISFYSNKSYLLIITCFVGDLTKKDEIEKALVESLSTIRQIEK